MITAETMRRIAPKQGAFARHLLECTADIMEREGLQAVESFLEFTIGFTWEESLQEAARHLLQIMRSPEVIDEWTPVGGEL